MKRNLTSLLTLGLILVCTSLVWSQNKGSQKILNPEFDKKLESMLSMSVPIVTVDQLDQMKESVTVLDARELEEYQTSHIPGAVFLGYDKWDKKMMESIDKNKPIVLYCSVGYRSEKIGEKLQKMGFTSVYNLYGSIFEWANQDKPLVDAENKPVKTVHTYNKDWSKWMTNTDYKKTW